LHEDQENNPNPYDFVLCIGDDNTDEDMFEELRKHDDKKFLFIVTVEKKPTLAKYYIENQQGVITTLRNLVYGGK
jgi:trehalose-phosphatase